MEAKLLLVSVVIAIIALPILAARDASPVRALRKTLLLIVVFNTLYLIAVRFLYPYLV
jgi:hypothetical protein